MHHLVPTLWFLGYPDQAMARCRELTAYWPDSPFLFNRLWRSLSLVQTLAWLQAPKGDDTQIEADLAMCDEQGFAFMGLVIRTLRGARLAQQGRVDEGIRDLKRGIEVHLTSGARFAVPPFFEFLAEAYLSIGQTEQGLAAVAEGLALSHSGGEHWVDAELYRLRGEFLLIGPSPDAAQAESCFLGSLEIARSQESKSFELRTATSLGRLWQRQGKEREARELLQPVYTWFTEGFDTHDLVAARELLDSLGHAAEPQALVTFPSQSGGRGGEAPAWPVKARAFLFAPIRLCCLPRTRLESANADYTVAWDGRPLRSLQNRPGLSRYNRLHVPPAFGRTVLACAQEISRCDRSRSTGLAAVCSEPWLCWAAARSEGLWRGAHRTRTASPRPS